MYNILISALCIQVAPALKGDLLDKLKVDSSDVIYLDNLDANIKAAQGLGMSTIKVGTNNDVYTNENGLYLTR